MSVGRKFRGINNSLNRVLMKKKTHFKKSRLPRGHQHERKRKEEPLRRNMFENY